MTIKEAKDAMRELGSRLVTFLPLYVLDVLLSSLALRKLLQKIRFSSQTLPHNLRVLWFCVFYFHLQPRFFSFVFVLFLLGMPSTLNVKDTLTMELSRILHIWICICSFLSKSPFFLFSLNHLLSTFGTHFSTHSFVWEKSEDSLCLEFFVGFNCFIKFS